MSPYYDDGIVTIYHGDCREVLPTIAAASVDLLFTDPPYPREFDHVWDILAEHAPRVLGPGRSLLTYLGHYQLPRVLDALNGPLRFNWLCIQRNLGAQPRMFGFRAVVAFKPILWFTNGPIKTPRLLCDEFPFEQNERIATKAAHAWGQPVSRRPILQLTEPGETVLDPFAGSGTTLIAAESTGRRAIGIELEERYCEIAASRCSQGVLDLGGAA